MENIRYDRYDLFLMGEYDYELGTLVMGIRYHAANLMGVIVGYDCDRDPLVFYLDLKQTLPEYRRHIEPLSKKHQK